MRGGTAPSYCLFKVKIPNSIVGSEKIETGAVFFPFGPQKTTIARSESPIVMIIFRLDWHVYCTVLDSTKWNQQNPFTAKGYFLWRAN